MLQTVCAKGILLCYEHVKADCILPLLHPLFFVITINTVYLLLRKEKKRHLLFPNDLLGTYAYAI